jgi:NitT/TauT family transport system substrate-binding protein
MVPAGCTFTPAPPVRIGASIWPGYECLFIARSLGFFEHEPIKLVEYASAPEVIRAFKNRALEIAAVSADEFLRLASEQADVRAFLVLDISQGADALVGRAEHQSLASLKGRRIGVEVNALGVFMLARALSSAGMSREDVQPVAIENDHHVVAFRENQVDAVVSFEPHRSRLLKNGGRVLFDSSQIAGEVVDYLVTRESVLRERGAVIRSLVRSWFKARERLLNEGEEIARLAAAREKVTPAEFLSFLDLLEIPSPEKNRHMLASGPSALEQLRETHSIMLEHGLIRGELPGTNLLDGRFLP